MKTYNLISYAVRMEREPFLAMTVFDSHAWQLNLLLNFGHCLKLNFANCATFDLSYLNGEFNLWEITSIHVSRSKLICSWYIILV